MKTQPPHSRHYIFTTYFVLCLQCFRIPKMNKSVQTEFFRMQSSKILVVSNLVRWNHSKSSNRNNLTLILNRVNRISQPIFLQIVLRLNLHHILLIRLRILRLRCLFLLPLNLTVYQYRLRITSKRKRIELICIRPIKLIQSR